MSNRRNGRASKVDVSRRSARQIRAGHAERGEPVNVVYARRLICTCVRRVVQYPRDDELHFPPAAVTCSADAQLQLNWDVWDVRAQRT